MSKDTGGPAFPQSQTLDIDHPEKGFVSGLDVGEGGMTLRDYFAAKSMQAYMTDPNAGWGKDDIDHVAGVSYRMADAMLKARQQ
jgi:hypothetical protein